jgi:hypothetical protein
MASDLAMAKVALPRLVLLQVRQRTSTWRCRPPPSQRHGERGWGTREEVIQQDPSGINLFPLGGGRYLVDTIVGLVYGAPNYLESKTNTINSIILHCNKVPEQNT